MVVGVVVHHAVAADLLLAHAALLLVRLKHNIITVTLYFYTPHNCGHLVALGAVGVLVLAEELAVQPLLAAVAAEALLVENLPECGAAVLSQLPPAVVATL